MSFLHEAIRSIRRLVEREERKRLVYPLAVLKETDRRAKTVLEEIRQNFSCESWPPGKTYQQEDLTVIAVDQKVMNELFIASGLYIVIPKELCLGDSPINFTVVSYIYPRTGFSFVDSQGRSQILGFEFYPRSYRDNPFDIEPSSHNDPCSKFTRLENFCYGDLERNDSPLPLATLVDGKLYLGDPMRVEAKHSVLFAGFRGRNQGLPEDVFGYLSAKPFIGEA